MKALLLGAGLGIVLSWFLTRGLISMLIKRGYGQFVRDDGPTSHSVKRGTPTMGGLAILLAIVLSYFLTHLISWTIPSASGLLLIALIVATGFLGFLDDWAKITKQRSLGLSARGKIIGQTIIGVGFGIAALQFPDQNGITVASQHISFATDISWLKVPLVVAILWMTLLITATSNAVNLTDGLDGLASGASAMVFGAFGLLGFWQYNQACSRVADAAGCYPVRNPHDLTLIALIASASCVGFLWWNAKPARIFMGDTGSLALGAGMAGLAIMTRTEILLVILGGLFVIETLSDIIQVSYFKMSGGKRVFKMAPIHHHFELLGWSEVTVVIRFWIICGVFVVTALALFYGQWLSVQ